MNHWTRRHATWIARSWTWIILASLSSCEMTDVASLVQLIARHLEATPVAERSWDRKPFRRPKPTTRPRIRRFLRAWRPFEITQVNSRAKKCNLFRLRNDGGALNYATYSTSSQWLRRSRGILGQEARSVKPTLVLLQRDFSPLKGFEMTDVAATIKKK